jgi:hypothetical protein
MKLMVRSNEERTQQNFLSRMRLAPVGHALPKACVTLEQMNAITQPLDKKIAK